MRYIDCKKDLRVKGNGGTLVKYNDKAGTIVEVSGGMITVVWDSEYPEKKTYRESITYLEPLNPQDVAVGNPDADKPATWPLGTQVQCIREGNPRYGWQGKIERLGEIEMRIRWDNGRDTFYQYDEALEYVKVIGFPKAVTKEDKEFQEVYNFFASHSVPGCCKSCGPSVPLPCKYHPNQ